MNNDPIELQSGESPRASVIVLHGLGASGDDFVPVCEQLDLTDCGPVRYVLPHAPQRPVTINGGFVMPAWYDILALGGRGAEDEAGLRASQALVETLIAREVSRGVAPERIVLAGFSQGGAIALHTGLRHAEPLAGILALSTYLPLAEALPREASDANAAVPVFMAHGTEDPVIPLSLAESSRAALEARGIRPQWHAYPMPHSVCAEEVADIGQWLARCLGNRIVLAGA